MKVLYVIPGQAKGTSMIFSKRQAEHLKKRGVDVKLFFLRSRTSITMLCREWKRFSQEIKNFRPNIVHAQNGTVTAIFSVILSNTPTVITYRGSDLNPCPSMAWLRSVAGHLFSQVAILGAKHAICVSDQLRKRLWFKHIPSAVIPSGVDTEVFRPQNRNEARRVLGWSESEKVVLFNVGRDPKGKRQDLVESAISVVHKTCEKVRLVVLNGEVNEQIIPLMMNASDCLVLTSDYEGSPNVVKEAIACNLPVVSVDVGDVKYRLSSVVPSWIVPRDYESLGSALTKALLQGKRSNGSFFTQEFSLCKTSDQLLDVYRKVLSDS